MDSHCLKHKIELRIQNVCRAVEQKKPTLMQTYIFLDLEKASADELCKICMDAPMECVMLECGHIATCIACGKRLSECPICRQYVIRVVRFFRS